MPVEASNQVRRSGSAGVSPESGRGKAGFIETLQSMMVTTLFLKNHATYWRQKNPLNFNHLQTMSAPWAARQGAFLPMGCHSWQLR